MKVWVWDASTKPTKWHTLGTYKRTWHWYPTSVVANLSSQIAPTYSSTELPDSMLRDALPTTQIHLTFSFFPTHPVLHMTEDRFLSPFLSNLLTTTTTTTIRINSQLLPLLLCCYWNLHYGNFEGETRQSKVSLTSCVQLEHQTSARGAEIRLVPGMKLEAASAKWDYLRADYPGAWSWNFKGEVGSRCAAARVARVRLAPGVKL